MNATESKVRKAKGGAVAFGAIALVCAAGAAVLISKLITAKGYDQEQKVPVLLAAQPVAAGEPLTPELVRVAMWPESNVPAGAFHGLDTLFPKDKRPPVCSTGILAGEPIVRARLADAAQGTAMAALVQPGYRAVSVKIDDAIARAGLLYPGAHVDVLGTLSDPNGRKVTTKVAVENVRVLSIEAQTDVESYKRKVVDNGKSVSYTPDAVVTIEVTPEQAELVFLAERNGKADLALRNATDTDAPPTRGADYAAFLGLVEPATKEKPAGGPAAIERPMVRARERPAVVRKTEAAAGIESYHAH